MTLTSQVIISVKVEETIAALEALQTSEKIIKILEEEKAFSVDDAKLAIEKAYMASEETTVIILAAKTFSPIVQNKLLKVIEEPPKNKAFILITQSKATASYPFDCNAIERSAAVTRSPELRSISISFFAGLEEKCSAYPMSLLVSPLIAETTTTTSLPSSLALATLFATFSIRSRPPTLVPPYLCTTNISIYPYLFITLWG
jgi:hypothetical protein